MDTIRYHGPAPSASWIGERDYVPFDGVEKWYEITGFEKDPSWVTAWILHVRWLDGPDAE